MIGTGVKVGGDGVSAGPTVSFASAGWEVEVGDDVGRTVGGGAGVRVGSAVPRAIVGDAEAPAAPTFVEVGVGDPPSEQATATIAVRRTAASPDARMTRRWSARVNRSGAFRDEPT